MKVEQQYCDICEKEIISDVKNWSCTLSQEREVCIVHENNGLTQTIRLPNNSYAAKILIDVCQDCWDRLAGRRRF